MNGRPCRKCGRPRELYKPCKPCHRAVDRAYYERTKDKYRQRRIDTARRWNAEHPERFAEIQRAAYARRKLRRRVAKVRAI